MQILYFLKNYVNVVVASKHLSYQWLDQNRAIEHCRKGIGILDFASNDEGNPDIVLASAGDTPNLEILAASVILRKNIPNIKVRVVNIIDLMRLVSEEDHPHGLSDLEYDKLFKIDRYNLVKLAIKHLKINSIEAIKLNDYCDIMLAKHKKYIKEFGIDMKEVTEFEFDFKGRDQYEL